MNRTKALFLAALVLLPIAMSGCGFYMAVGKHPNPVEEKPQ